MDSNYIDIASAIAQTINNLFSNLLASIDNSMYSILDDLLFINANIVNNNYLEAFFGSRFSGIILICNSLLVGFALYYGLSLLFSYITLSRNTKAR